jgi:uncharacterized glyoxalase superfamily protein PhnB
MSIGHCVPYVRVKDARASLDYYHRCLGFHKEWEQDIHCIAICRGSLRFFLSERAEDGAFGICVYCTVNDADRLHTEFRRAGARELSEVVEMPWGRDFSVRDLDGNELRFGSPRPDASVAA